MVHAETVIYAETVVHAEPVVHTETVVHADVVKMKLAILLNVFFLAMRRRNIISVARLSMVLLPHTFQVGKINFSKRQSLFHGEKGHSDRIKSFRNI